MILDEIAEKTRIRVAGAKQKISPEEMKQKALACDLSLIHISAGSY